MISLFYIMEMKHTPESSKPELRLVRSPEVTQAHIPKLTPEALEQICRLETSPTELKRFDYLADDDQKVIPHVIRALLERDFKNELPIEEPIFPYKRNLQECDRLKKVMYSAFNSKDRSPETEQKLTEASSKLLALELRKADWLETEFYPNVFDTAITTARAEVNQFLIGQKNTKYLEQFRDASLPAIYMQDELNYLLDGNPPETAGVYSSGGGYDPRINLRIPNFFTDKDEWRVYLTAVHELLHSVSHQDWGDVGIDKRSIDPDLEALNEATTQLLTYHIALQHLENEKTPLRKQRERRLSLATMPYSEYTLIVRQIFSKIPMDYFTDAMLNQSGWEKLRLKFREMFGSEDAVISYARNLRDAYIAPQKRKKSNEEQKKGNNVIPLVPRKQKPRLTSEDTFEEE